MPADARNPEPSPGEGTRAERGREARSPARLGVQGWRDALLRGWGRVLESNLGLVAAGVAFYILLAIFPALAAAVAGYGLFADPSDARAHVSALAGIIPEQALALIEGQLTSLASGDGGSLGIGLGLTIAVALWGASKGARALMTALDITYREHDRRGLVAYYALSLAVTAGGIAYVALALTLIVALPAAWALLGLSENLQVLLNLGRWLLLCALSMLGLALLYRLVPQRSQPRWRWVSAGAVVATALWLSGSALFSLYVSQFAAYHETYGSVGAVVVLLMWCYVSAWAVLVGGQINAEAEHQTRRDSTAGAERPMGERGATVADHLGESP